MESRLVYSWTLPTFKLANGDRLVYLKDESGNTLAFIPVWELDYYRWLCGNEFVYRSRSIAFGIGDAVKVVIPEDLAATLPSVMGNYTGLRRTWEIYRSVGNLRKWGIYLNSDPTDYVRDRHASFTPVESLTVAEVLGWGA